ncbi:MAG: VWA domain-containing protein, partial [Peptococcaceae bacterium]|nr:VWA domain-containing protein [Peptococcaceae bacterium]
MNSKKHKLPKRLLAMLLTITMFVTMFPAGAFAANNTEQGGAEPAQPVRVENGDNNVSISKEATRVDATTWNVTMTVDAHQDIQAVPLDVALVLDTSPSMDYRLDDNHDAEWWEDSRLDVVKDAAKDLVDELAEVGNVNVGLVQFHGSASRVEELTSLDENGGASSVKTKIEKLNTDRHSGTNIKDGLSKANEMLNGKQATNGAQKVVILLSDGDYNRGGSPQETADSMKWKGIEIFSIGFADRGNAADTLKGIASEPTEEHFFRAENATELVNAFKDIAYEITALINDKVGDDVTIKDGTMSAKIGGNVDDHLIVNGDNKGFRWNPDAEEGLKSGQTLTITYQVTLDGNAADYWDNPQVTLNEDAHLNYRIGDSGRAHTLQLEPLMTTVDVAQLRVYNQIDEGREVSDGAPQYVFIYSNATTEQANFTWDKPKDTFQGANYVGSTLTEPDATESSVKDETTYTPTTAGAYKLVHHYSHVAEYTLTYDANGGEGSMQSETYQDGSEVTVKDNGFTNPGYKFVGWNTKEDGSGTSYDAKDTFKITGDTTLYAQWKKDASQTHKLSYTVKYYKDGKIVKDDTDIKTEEVWDGDSRTTLKVDKDAINTTNKYRGYKFDRTEPTTIPEEIENGDVIEVYYVKDESQTHELSYKVEYYKDNELADTDIVTKDVWDGDLTTTLDVDKDAINTKDKYPGYKFDRTEPVKIPDTIENGDMIKVYYVTNTYDLFYDANGGTYANGENKAVANGLEPGNYKLWEDAAKPADVDQPPKHEQVDKKDVVFIGWTAEKDDKIYAKGDEMPEIDNVDIKDANVTVYAVWGYDENGNGTPDVEEKLYTLTYDANGGAFGNFGGASQAVVNDLLADTYKLWTKDNSGTQPAGEKEWPKWYQSQGVDVVMIGWTAKEDNEIYAKGDKMPEVIDEATIKDQNVTVYAVWGYDENGNGTPDVEESSYTLTYDANGGAFGKPGGASQAAVNGLSSDIAYKLWAKDPEVIDDVQPENEAKWPAFYQSAGVDVVMIGWTAKEDNKIYAKGDKMPEVIDEVTIKDKDVTVYAVWGYDENGNGKPDVEESSYTLTYDANGGAFGKPGGASQAIVNGLSSDIAYKLWAKDPEVTDDTQPENEAKWPAFYNVSGDNNVVMIGWTAEEDDKIYKKGDKMPELIDEVTIKDKDVTVYAVWGYDNNGNGTPDVEEDFHTLTYDANGGAFGDKTAAAATGLAANDYPLWDKKAGTIPEGDIPVGEDGVALLPTHAKAEPPEGTVISDAELVDVVLLGWTTKQPTEPGTIYAAGEEYPTLANTVTIKDADATVYAVWGYDENGDGVADAQQIVITPADITIYEGGTGYEGVLDGDDVIGTNENGLPEPGYYFILPYQLDDELGGAGNIIDLSDKLHLAYDNANDPTDKRGWNVELYNKDHPEQSMAYGKYVYRLVPETEGYPVRLEIRDAQGNLQTSDEFNISLDSLYQTFSMKLYTAPEVDRVQVTAQVRDDSGNWVDVNDKLQADVVQGIARGTASLTIRGTTDEDPVSIIQDDVTDEVDTITAVQPDGVTYYVNDSDIPVVMNQDENNVKLLNDTIVDENGSQAAMENAIVDAAAKDADIDIDENDTFDFRYLDLVDTDNGDAYVTLGDGQEMTIYWPYPEGMDANDTFYVAHFDGLDRDFAAGDLGTAIADADLKLYHEGDDTYKLEKTENGIKFTTSSFSPFALVYDNEGSGTIDPPPVDPGEPGGGGDNPPALNTEDHFSYVVGYEDGMVKPQRNITRAEVSSIFYRLLEDEVRDDNTTDVSDFSDVSASDWYGTTVATLSKMGIVKGYEDGTFRPNAPITRAE